MDGVKEYDIIKRMNGMTYKLFNVIRVLTKEGHTDLEGYVTLSHKSISMKLGIGNNVTRIIRDLDKFPEAIEINHGNTSYPNRFRIKEEYRI